jgi:hypothetical protein
MHQLNPPSNPAHQRTPVVANQLQRGDNVRPSPPNERGRPNLAAIFSRKRIVIATTRPTSIQGRLARKVYEPAQGASDETIGFEHYESV